MNNFNNNQKKYTYKVLETMEWRSKTYEQGETIEDTDNTYMRAMVHQGKLEKIN